MGFVFFLMAKSAKNGHFIAVNAENNIKNKIARQANRLIRQLFLLNPFRQALNKLAFK